MSDKEHLKDWPRVVKAAEVSAECRRDGLVVSVDILLAVARRVDALERYARESAGVLKTKEPGIRPKLTDISRRVVYLPLHAGGDHWHPDCEHGYISCFREQPNGEGWFEVASVKYDDQPAGAPGRQTSVCDLLWFEDWRPRVTPAVTLRQEVMQRLRVDDDDGSEIFLLGPDTVIFRQERFLNPEAAILAQAYNVLRALEPAPSA